MRLEREMRGQIIQGLSQGKEFIAYMQWDVIERIFINHDIY